MRLSVSTIVWPDAWDPAFYTLLSAHKIDLVDIAPTMISKSWDELTPQRLAAFRSFVRDQGFAIAGMQSLFFNLPEARLFGTAVQRQQFIDQLYRLADIATQLGATRLVLGSPPNRNRGEWPLEDACACFVEHMRPVLERYQDAGLVLCLEANPAPYGSDFMTSYGEAAALVSRMDMPGFRLNFDTGCCVLGGGDPVQAVAEHSGLYGHVHISEPHLKDLSVSLVDHPAVSSALLRAGYDGVACLEMRGGDDPGTALSDSLRVVCEVYRGGDA